MINIRQDIPTATEELFASILSFVETHEKPLLVILGPTASGKTDFALTLATGLPKHQKHAEVINADSRQLFKYLSIGTAKITKSEMRGIPHHLLDVLDPKEFATIAWYKEEATKVIDQLHRKGVIPMLVGGSMLYISAIIDGLEPLPEATEELRKKLQEEYERDGGQTLRRRLVEIDPEFGASIPHKNKRYLVRAMEIAEMTKERPSRVKTQKTCPYDLFIIGITREKNDLHERIQKRIEKMFSEGWVGEVRSLLQKGYTHEDPGMLSHGYREIAEFLSTPNDSMHKLQESIATQTRHYAKRQMTWWRGDPRIHWITLPGAKMAPHLVDVAGATDER